MPRVRVIKVPAEPAVQTQTVEPSRAVTELGQAARPVDQPPVAVETAVKQFTISKKALVVLAVAATLLLVFAFAVGQRSGGVAEVKGASSPSASTGSMDAAQSEAMKYHNLIKNIVEVPAEQTPSLVTVSDASKLIEKSPVLFKYSKNGDVVLFYVNQDKTGKAILYRPTTKKVIAVVDGSTENTTDISSNKNN